MERSSLPLFHVFYVLMFICVGVIIFLYSSETIFPRRIERVDYDVINMRLKERNKTYIILLYEKPVWMKLNNILLGKSNCEFQNCNFSSNIEDFNKSDVVLFHHSSMNVKPPVKRNNQIWIFYSFESPIYTNKHYKKKEWQGVFDWTYSYRNDSDIKSKYGHIIKGNKSIFESKNYSKIYHEKTKEVFWVVSHCEPQSKRNIYVQKMREVIDVTIYGNCGQQPCRDNCFSDLCKRYKFYLSFENSLCLDYLTEKVYRFFNQNIDIIPVVRGPPNIKELLPNGTFIPTIDFKTPQELAFYLKTIGENETLYSSFLSNKNQYESVSGGNMYCSLCTSLNNHVPKNPSMSISKWIQQRGCIEPNDL